MAKLTGAQTAEKWGSHLKSASDSITAGVAAVTKAPTLSASEKQDKMRANIIKAIDDGRWKKGLLKVSLSDWQEAMTERGIPRIAAGVDGAQSDMGVFFDELAAFQAPLSAKIDKMPDVTLEDSIARMTAQVRGMAQFTRKS
jgi:hypothetical protein